jgi:hypothetical protein
VDWVPGDVRLTMHIGRVTFDRHLALLRMTFRVTSLRIMNGTGARCLGFERRRADVHPTQRFIAGRTTVMTAQDHPRRSTGPRSGSRRPGSTRPREAPRPKLPSARSTGIRLCPATFVDLMPDQERNAIEALAELMVPLVTGQLRRSADEDAPSAVTPSAGER